MKKIFKILIISIGMNLFFTNNFVFAFQKDIKYKINLANKKNYYSFHNLFCREVFFSIKNEDITKNFLLELNPSLSLVAFYVLESIPNISKDVLKDFCSLKYSQSSCDTIILKLTEQEKIYINSYLLKHITEIKNKNVNFNNTKSKYINFVEKTIKENLDYIRKIEENKKNKIFIINFEKEIISHYKEVEGKNILKNTTYDNDEILYKNGLKSVEKEIKFRKAKIHELEKIISYIKKITINSFKKTKNAIETKQKEKSYLTDAYIEDSRLEIIFDNVYIKNEILKKLYTKYFSHCLFETIMESEDKEEFKKYFEMLFSKRKKEYEKNKEKISKNFTNKSNLYSQCFYNTLKNYVPDEKDVFLDEETNSATDKGLVINFCHDLDYTKILAKYIQSKKFKEKLKKNLNQENFEILRKYFDKNLNLLTDINKKLSKTYENMDDVSLGTKIKQQNLNSSKTHLEEAKEVCDEESACIYEEDIEKTKEDLNDLNKIKLEGKMKKKSDFKNLENIVSSIKKDQKKLNKFNFADFKTIFNLANIDEVSLHKSIYRYGGVYKEGELKDLKKLIKK